MRVVTLSDIEAKHVLSVLRVLQMGGAVVPSPEFYGKVGDGIEMMESALDNVSEDFPELDDEDIYAL